VKTLVKRALIVLCKGLEWSPHRNCDAIVTLMHEVGSSASDYNISEPVFRDQLSYLLEHDVTWYKATELALNLKHIVTSNSVCITFDDGTVSAYHATLELIDSGAYCSHFIIPERVNRKDVNSMTWSQIRELDSAGVEIGSHTLTHPHLIRLGEKGLNEELTTSKIMLEDRLGKSITSFAYPYGEYDNRVIEAVADSGYSCAFTTRHLYASRESDVFQIPRFEPLGSVNQLAEIYQGQGHWFYRLLNDYYRVRDLAR
jgi:peptidoglycan/xylan/chitin deacetylase (PgdA/CDA1 family)